MSTRRTLPRALSLPVITSAPSSVTSRYSQSSGNPYGSPATPQYQSPGTPISYQSPGTPQYQSPGTPLFQSPGTPQFQIGSPQYQVPSPQYQVPSPQYQIPSPQYQIPTVPGSQYQPQVYYHGSPMHYNGVPPCSVPSCGVPRSVYHRDVLLGAVQLPYSNGQHYGRNPQLDKVQSALHQLLQNQDEGRRHLMMDQEEVKDQDIAKGAIDVTSLSSPGPAHSSGYCSADEDHSYSSSKTRETYSPGIHSPGALSSISTSSLPHTPSSIHSPVGLGTANMVTPTMIEEKMQEFNTDELNLFDMIGEMLPPNSLPNAELPSGSSLADSWLNSLDNDIEMMDVDQNNGLPPPLDVSSDGEGLLLNILKDSEKHAAFQQSKDELIANAGTITNGLNPLMAPLSTSTVITQSNVMFSSATRQSTGAMSGTDTRTNYTQPKNNLVKNSPLPMSIATSMDTTSMGRVKANLTVAEFPSGLLGLADNDTIDSSNEFALKFAENMVDQQINATLASYMTDTDSLMDSSGSVQDSSLNGLSGGAYNMLNDTGISHNSSLSQFLTSPTPIVSSIPTSRSITTSSHPNSTSPPNPTIVPASKPTLFATPKAPPPGSAQAARQNLSKSQPISRTVTVSQQPPLVKVSSTTSKSSYPGCDDHRYTSKQLDSPPHKSNSHRNAHRANGYRHHNHSHSSNHNNPHHQPRLLEKFLLTKEKLNPNKGSDDALATHGLSQLHLGEVGSRNDPEILDGNQQLLKKLLTEEIQPKDVHKSQQEVIMDRRQSAGSSPTCGSPTLMHNFSLDPDDLSNSIQLLGEDTAGEMDKLWAPPSGDEAIPSELDEILREEMRQNDLWLQHCINELL